MQIYSSWKLSRKVGDFYGFAKWPYSNPSGSGKEKLVSISQFLLDNGVSLTLKILKPWIQSRVRKYIVILHQILMKSLGVYNCVFWVVCIAFVKLSRKVGDFYVFRQKWQKCVLLCTKISKKKDFHFWHFTWISHFMLL